MKVLEFVLRFAFAVATIAMIGSTSAQASNGSGRAFPLGPLKSEVEPITLKGLTGDGTLTSNRFSIETELSSRAWSEELFYDYSLDDTRFDEVQAYYYVQVALEWFRTSIRADLNEPLTVKVHVGGDEPTNAAFYYGNKIFLGRGDGVLYQNMIHDPTIVMHEVTHAIIDQYSGLDNTGDAGAMNEGFADFFTAMILNHPLIGEASYMQGPFRRNLANDLRAFVDFQGKKYADSLVLSGTLWQIAEVIGKPRGSMLAFDLLKRLGRKPEYADIFPAFLSVLQNGYSDAEQAAVVTVLEERNWNNSL